MTTIRGWGVGLALAIGGAGLAAAQQGGALSPREFFELLDANHDQVIEKSEVPESGQAAFEKLLKNGDTNKNGRLEQDEYRALVASLGNAGGSTPVPAPAVGEFGARLAAADKNGDGKLSKEEWPGAPEVFARIDADKDGFVTKEEAQKFFAAQGGAGMGGPALLERLKAMDKNGDGKISKDEFTGPEPQFKRIDADGDGMITKEEAEKFRPGGPLGIDRFRAMDKNGDGKLSRDEFDGPPAAFDRIDADNDGFITPQEIREVMQGAAKKAAAKKDSQ